MVLRVRGSKGRGEGGLRPIRKKKYLEIKYINYDDECISAWPPSHPVQSLIPSQQHTTPPCG
jgi:hypothetical protein